MPGKFITLEGPEGSGKSTHAARLVARLAARGVPVLGTREPGGTPLGEAIRKLLKHDAAGEGMCMEAETFLFEASRAELARKIILPALERGTWVICDRFADSTTAYQGHARGLDLAGVQAMNAMAMGGAVPDLTILLDLDVTKGFARLAERQGAAACDRIEREGPEFHGKVRAGFLALARANPLRFRVVDADRPQDVVHEDVWSIVADLPGVGA